MHDLLASIDTGSLIGLRDRALIGLMGYTFARVGAAVGMKIEDYYVQKKRGWVRLHEKGGKVTELPCHHNLEAFLDDWIAASGLSQEPDARCSRRCGMGSWRQTRKASGRLCRRRMSMP